MEDYYYRSIKKNMEIILTSMTLLTVVGITKRIIDIDNCRHLKNNML